MQILNGNMMRRKRFIRLIPAALIMLLIFLHSAMPADMSSAESGFLVDILTKVFHLTISVETLTFIIRKAAHFTEYLLLGLSLRWGMESSFLHVWLIGVVYAVTDEIHQLFVPGRSCEFRDICIDAAGVLAGVLLMRAIERRQIRKTRAK